MRSGASSGLPLWARTAIVLTASKARARARRPPAKPPQAWHGQCRPWPDTERDGDPVSPRTSSNDGASAGVNRDTLLKALFPNGVPPRESVLREVSEWLDRGERLAKLR